MICKACGAQNQSGSKFCRICASSLEDVADEVAVETPQYSEPSAADSDSGAAADDAAADKSAWGFVRSPKWPQPQFSAETVLNEDIPLQDAPAEEAQQSYTGYSPRYAPQREQVSEPELYDQTPAYGYEQPQSYIPQRGYAPQQRYSPSQGGSARPYGSVPQRGTVYSMEDDNVSPVVPVPRAAYDSKPRGGKAKSDYGYAYGKARGGTKRSSHKGFDFSSKKNLLFWIAAGALLVVIIVLAIVLLTGKPADPGNSGSSGSSGGSFLSGLFSSSPVTSEPLVEKTTTDKGDPAYAITIYAKNGTTVRFTAGDSVKDIPVTDGKVGVRISEAIWIPQDPVESSPVVVTPDFKIVAADGTETQVEMEPISIDVPSIDVKLTSPETTSIVTDSKTLTIAGTVSDSGAAVFVNDQQFPVDETGSFTGTYELNGVGAQKIVVEGRKGGCKIGRATIDVEVSQAAAVSIGLAEGGTLRSTGDSFTVKCTMDTGSTVTVAGDIVSDVQFDSAAGTFSFTASTPSVGQYKASVTVTKDGVSATKELHIERAPDLETYSAGAHRMDYDRIKAAPTHDQAYKCVGTIDEIIEEGDTVLAKMDVGDGNTVVIEYHPNYPSSATIKANDGVTYSIFAYPNGTHEETGLPLMYAWFVLKK